MFEKALSGGRRYGAWMGALALVVCAGVWAYAVQFERGLGVTGLSRDVTWGLYIAQFTFFVGVAASAVMVVLPYYLHDYRAFGRALVLGEFVSISALFMSGLFIVVDMGQPARILNVLRYPTPSSLMFWDLVALGGYLVLNVAFTRATLESERMSVAPPRWSRWIAVLSIPWAVSIHTVTAFLYSGLPGRSFWLTAVLAPRFLASAFAAGPAILILACLIVRRLADYDVGRDAIRRLAVIVAYAMCMHVFLVLMEVFSVFYSQVPEHVAHFRYLFVGIDGHASLVPWMWTSAVLAVATLPLLIVPSARERERVLIVTCVAVVVSIWIDKGLGLVVGGLVPAPSGAVIDYVPTVLEVMITAAIWAAGLMLATAFFRIAIGVRRETGEAAWRV